MAESPQPVTPSGRLSRSALARIGESTARQESIFGGTPRIDMGPGESTVQGPADSFWIRIDAVGTNGQYAATEVARAFGQPLGTLDQPPGDARTWMLTDNPVFEANLSTAVKVGEIHRAWNSGQQGTIEFDATGGGGGSGNCGSCLCVVKNSLGYVTDIQYTDPSGNVFTVPVCPTTPCAALAAVCPSIPAAYSLAFPGVTGIFSTYFSPVLDGCIRDGLQSPLTMSYNSVSCLWQYTTVWCVEPVHSTPIYLQESVIYDSVNNRFVAGVALASPGGSVFPLLNPTGGNSANVVYALASGSWSCLGPNTLTLSLPDSYDTYSVGLPNFGSLTQTWPATITINPV